jgi:hypothetical protein
MTFLVIIMETLTEKKENGSLTNIEVVEAQHQ